MEPLLIPFVAAALGEFGDKTQLLVIALLARHGRATPIVFGVLAAAAIASAIAALGGAIIHDIVVLRATTLLVALAFLTAGIGGFFAARAPGIAAPARMPLFLVTLICFLAAEIGDKTQFITAALAAHYDSPALTAFGAAAGIFVTSLSAVMLGSRLTEIVPIRTIRLCVSIVFILVGSIVAINALRLI